MDHVCVQPLVLVLLHVCLRVIGMAGACLTRRPRCCCDAIVCRRGVAHGHAGFGFATRSDGSPKVVKGALGGGRMVSGKQREDAVKQRIAQVWMRKTRGCP